MDTLLKIKSQRKLGEKIFNIIIATHSPQIVHNRRDLCVELNVIEDILEEK